MVELDLEHVVLPVVVGVEAVGGNPGGPRQPEDHVKIILGEGGSGPVVVEGVVLLQLV